MTYGRYVHADIQCILFITNKDSEKQQRHCVIDELPNVLNILIQVSILKLLMQHFLLTERYEVCISMPLYHSSTKITGVVLTGEITGAKSCSTTVHCVNTVCTLLYNNSGAHRLNTTTLKHVTEQVLLGSN